MFLLHIASTNQNRDFYMCIYQTHLLQAGCNAKSILKQRTANFEESSHLGARIHQLHLCKVLRLSQ